MCENIIRTRPTKYDLFIYSCQVPQHGTSVDPLSSPFSLITPQYYYTSPPSTTEFFFPLGSIFRGLGFLVTQKQLAHFVPRNFFGSWSAVVRAYFGRLYFQKYSYLQDMHVPVWISLRFVSSGKLVLGIGVVCCSNRDLGWLLYWTNVDSDTGHRWRTQNFLRLGNIVLLSILHLFTGSASCRYVK